MTPRLDSRRDAYVPPEALGVRERAREGERARERALDAKLSRQFEREWKVPQHYN